MGHALVALVVLAGAPAPSTASPIEVIPPAKKPSGMSLPMAG